MRPLPPVLLSLFVVLSAGCASPPPPVEVPPPTSYDPAAAVAAAFTEYDRDKNGFIEGTELDACPALKWALAGLDTNRDGKVSREELQARFEAYVAANASAVTAQVTVTLDGAPLAGATVLFVPEGFMGPGAAEVTATAKEDGTTTAFTVSGKEYMGLAPGFYKVKVTGPAGKAVAAKYNTQTTLGAEVGGGRGSKPLTFALSSR